MSTVFRQKAEEATRPRSQLATVALEGIQVGGGNNESGSAHTATGNGKSTRWYNNTIKSFNKETWQHELHKFILLL